MPPFGQQNSGGKNGGDQNDLLAICAGGLAAFLWADPAFELTLGLFRSIAIQNYGREALPALEWVYWLLLHVAIFAITRIAVLWLVAMLVMGLGVRLAGVF
jgi:hypothetical protein